MQTATTTGDVIRDVVPAGWGRFRHRLLDLMIDYGTVLALVALFAYFALTTPYFLTTDNLVNIGRFAAVGGILAAAFTFALITSQVDLTLGPAISVAAITYAVLAERHDQPVLVAVALTLALSLAIGLANGVLVV